MHIDNAKSHNSALSLQKTEELGIARLAQPPYSPDMAPCDFFLFDYLKKELHGKNFRSKKGVISVVRAIVTNIPMQRLLRVFPEWIERLYECIANEGEYIEINICDLICYLY
jgi:transposase